MLDVASGLLDAGAVRLNPAEPFTWASGMKSPIYCDNRQLLGFTALRCQIAEALAEKAQSLAPTLIAGTSTAGIPWATMVADRLQLPLAYVRPEPKKHGMGRQVEGPHVKGHRVVLVEDLISTGGSSMKCVDAVRAEGGEIATVLALFSYELPIATRAFQQSATPIAVLAGFEALLVAAQTKRLVAESHLDSLRAWRQDVNAWSQARGGV